MDTMYTKCNENGWNGFGLYIAIKNTIIGTVQTLYWILNLILLAQYKLCIVSGNFELFV